MALNREDIIACKDRKIVTVDVPEWGGTVHVRGMSGEERNSYEMLLYAKETIDYSNVTARLLVRCICDDKGNRIFSDDDDKMLGAKDANVLYRLAETAKQLSGLSTTAQEDIAKN